MAAAAAARAERLIKRNLLPHSRSAFDVKLEHQAYIFLLMLRPERADPQDVAAGDHDQLAFTPPWETFRGPGVRKSMFQAWKDRMLFMKGG